jgi:hypothetical protein
VADDEPEVRPKDGRQPEGQMESDALGFISLVGRSW